MSAREIGEALHAVVEESLDDGGYVLTHLGVTTAGNLLKATSTYYYELAGVNLKSTEDLANPDTYLADVEVAYVKRGQVRVQLIGNASRSTNIIKGSLLAVHSIGKVCEWADSPIDTLLGTVNAANLLKMLTAIVGVAQEACLATADTSDGKILTELDIK